MLSRTIELQAVDTPNQLDATVAASNRLVRNLLWAWNQDAQDVFEELSPRAWRHTYHNAVAVPRDLSDEELPALLLDKEFNCPVQGALQQLDAYMNVRDTWAAEDSARFDNTTAAH